MAQYTLYILLCNKNYFSCKISFAACSDGDGNLLNGGIVNEGKLQICVNGTWGSVCASKDFSNTEARVVCRHLGYTDKGLFTCLI